MCVLSESLPCKNDCFHCMNVSNDGDEKSNETLTCNLISALIPLWRALEMIVLLMTTIGTKRSF